MYLDKSCSTSRLLSQGDGRGTQWGRSPAGSPGGHPDRCTGCRAGVRRSGRPGVTPPRGSMSSHHAHRLGQGRQEASVRAWIHSHTVALSHLSEPHSALPQSCSQSCYPSGAPCFQRDRGGWRGRHHRGQNMPEAGKSRALRPDSMGIPALCLLIGRSWKPTSSPLASPSL